ncbi:MAG: hypothetical protein ACRYFV_14590 [Janthinobacterium lividum]
MVFYGTNGTHLRTEALPQVACPACGTSRSLRASLFGHYAHLYSVPVFPFAKLAAVQCGSCQTIWASKDMPAAIAPAVQDLKQQTQQPYWTWAGLALLLLVTTFGFLHSLRDMRPDETMLTSPRAGDIYTVRTDSANMYSLLKVQQVSGNSVALLANEFQSNDSSPINALNAPEKYSKEPFIITRLDLQIMRHKGDLTDVERP